MTASTTELFEAIGAADPDRVRQALDGGADPDSRHPAGYSALVLAAGAGDAAVVRRLLAAGAAVNSPRDPRYRHERAWGPITSCRIPPKSSANTRRARCWPKASATERRVEARGLSGLYPSRRRSRTTCMSSQVGRL